jgi:hypothetical protein
MRIRGVLGGLWCLFLLGCPTGEAQQDMSAACSQNTCASCMTDEQCVGTGGNGYRAFCAKTCDVTQNCIAGQRCVKFGFSTTVCIVDNLISACPSEHQNTGCPPSPASCIDSMTLLRPVTLPVGLCGTEVFRCANGCSSTADGGSAACK